MPRPKRPKLVHTVPSTLRVAKSAAQTAQPHGKQRPHPSSAHLANSKADHQARIGRRQTAGKGASKSSGTDNEGGVSSSETVSTNGERRGRKQVKTASFVSKIDPKEVIGESGESKRGRLASKGPKNPTVRNTSTGPMPFSSRPSGPGLPPTANAGRRPNLFPGSQYTPLGQSSVLGTFPFKKRTRQPSLLQVAQSQRDDSAGPDDSDLGEFQPDDESTPLSKSMAHSQRQTSSSSQQLSGSRKRKLATPEVQVRATQSQQHRQSSPLSISSRQADSFDLPPDDENELPEPTLPTLRRTRTPSPQIFSDILAPPESSSSPGKEPPRPKRPNKPTSATGAESHDLPAPSPAPGSSKRQPAKSRTRNPPSPKPLTTARLQNLLPRRRARLKKQGTYDIPSSSDVELDATNLAEDEDELSLHAASKMRKKKTRITVGGKPKQKGGKEVAERPLKGKRVSQTYSRRSVVESHSEDGNDRDELEERSLEVSERTGKTLPALDVKAKAEMKRLADKFREVDDYALDFENLTGSSSQMRDAR